MSENRLTPEDYYPLEKILQFTELSRKAEGEGKIDVVDRIRREINLLNRPFATQGQIADVWGWCKEHPNKPFPDWKNIDVEYYKKRYAENANPLEKARYAYAVWTLGKGIEFAHNTVSYFLKAAKLYLSKGWYKKHYLVMKFCFEFAGVLSITLGMKAPIGPPTIFGVLSSAIQELHHQGVKGRGMSDLIEAGAYLAQKVYANDSLRNNPDVKAALSPILDVARKIAESWDTNKEFHWYRSYLSAIAPIVKITDGLDAANKIKIKIAESWCEEADSRSEPLVKVAFYQNALKDYSNLGISSKIEDVKNRIQEFSKLAVKDFKEISAVVNIPSREIVSVSIQSFIGKSPDQNFAAIAGNHSLIPDKKRIIERVQEMRRRVPLSFVLPRTIFYRDAPAKKITSEKEIFEYEVKRQFNIESEILGFIASEILKEVFTVFADKDDLKIFLRRSKNISENSIKLLEKGIDRNFEGDYVSSVHIFIPQIEETLRTLLKNRGIDTSKYDAREQGLSEKLLGGLLDEARPFLDENFSEYLDVRLTPNGANIRNKVCHGWMESEKFTQELSNELLHIILKLSAL